MFRPNSHKREQHKRHIKHLRRKLRKRWRNANYGALCSKRSPIRNILIKSDLYAKDPHRSKRIYHPSRTEERFLWKINGWKAVPVSFVEMQGIRVWTLKIGEFIFYQPIEPVCKWGFEHFFGFGRKCMGFSFERTRFSYGKLSQY